MGEEAGRPGLSRMGSAAGVLREQQEEGESSCLPQVSPLRKTAKSKWRPPMLSARLAFDSLDLAQLLPNDNKGVRSILF